MKRTEVTEIKHVALLTKISEIVPSSYSGKKLKLTGIDTLARENTEVRTGPGESGGTAGDRNLGE